MSTVETTIAAALIKAVAAQQITERQALAYLKAGLTAEQITVILDAHKPEVKLQMPNNLKDVLEKLAREKRTEPQPPHPYGPGWSPSREPILYKQNTHTILDMLPVTCNTRFA